MAQGHRKRLRELVEKVGLENLSVYQQMEYILFYVLPRIDTTDIAHRLIDAFGSIDGVLEAPASQLKKIEGLGHDSAMQLSHLLQILKLYNISKNSHRRKVCNLHQVADLLKDIYVDKSKEYILAIALTKKYELLGCKILAEGEEEFVKLNKMVVINFVSSYFAQNLIICHNHPYDTCKPSSDDIRSTDELEKVLSAIGVRLLDNIIFGKDGIFSFREKLSFYNTPISSVTIDYSSKSIIERLGN